MCQTNFFATIILTNVSFLIIKNAALFEVPHMTSNARLIKRGTSLRAFLIAYEENEDLYKITSKKPEFCTYMQLRYISYLNVNKYASV